MKRLKRTYLADVKFEKSRRVPKKLSLLITARSAKKAHAKADRICRKLAKMYKIKLTDLTKIINTSYDWCD